MTAPWILVGIFLFVFLFMAGLVWWILRLARKQPENTPAHFLKHDSEDDRQPLFVCLGDSLTHGSMSANYVDMLAERFGNLTWVNAGVNAEVAYEALLRLDEVIKLQPDYVSILIGTNDANLQLLQDQWQVQFKINQLPGAPEEDSYRQNLLEIIRRLQAETSAQITLLSLPTIGEDSDHISFQQAARYSQIIKDVAEEMGIAYLPLNERMTAYLQEHSSAPKYPFEKWDIAMSLLGFKRLVLHRNLDRIAEEHGFVLHVDHLHLNTSGAKMIADLIEEFIGDAG